MLIYNTLYFAMYFTTYLTIYLLCHITYHIPYRIPYHIPYIYSISYHIIHHIHNPLISLINSVSASRLCHCLVPRFKALAPPRCLLSHTQSNPLLPSLYTLHPPRSRSPLPGQVLQPVSLLIMFLFYLLPTLQLHVITLLLPLLLLLSPSLFLSLDLLLSLCLPLTCCQSLHCKLCGTFHCSTNLIFFL